MKETSPGSTSWIRREATQFADLMHAMPIPVIVLFSLSVILMNLLSNFIVVNLPFLALNAGVFVSWVAFLFMDIVSKHFGARAANWLSIIAILANGVAVAIFFAISKIGTFPKLDMILNGQWSILLASTIAFIASAVFNNVLNVGIGRLFHKNPDGKLAFFTRSYVSTFLGQCVDNFLFVFLAFVIFPSIPGAAQIYWTVPQCVGASLFCALLELVLEVVFSPIGYRVSLVWKRKGVGKEYIDRYCTVTASEQNA